MSSSPFDLLPTEVVQKIFLSCDISTTLCLKFSRTSVVQLVISHVSSRWRSIALSTFQLWDNLELYWSSQHGDLTVQVASAWFYRAGRSLITLRVYRGSDVPLDDPHIHQLCRLISFYRFKCLGGQFRNCWHLLHDKSYEVALDCLEDLSLIYPIPPLPERRSLASGDNYCQLPSLRYLSLDFRVLPVSRNRDLCMMPWHQVTTLVIRNAIDFSSTLEIIRECKALVECKLPKFRADDNIQVMSLATSLPCLRSLTMGSKSLHLIRILSSLIVPSLTSIYLSINERYIYQLPEMDWLSNHLDAPFQQIRDFTLWAASNIVNVGIFLRRMPSLCTLALEGDIFLDLDTAEHISTGQLGRHINSISLKTFRRYRSHFAVEDVLDMIEKRQENAKSDEGQNLQPFIYVGLAFTAASGEKYKETAEYLERSHNVRIQLDVRIR